jgi:hypothetical protein
MKTSFIKGRQHQVYCIEIFSSTNNIFKASDYIDCLIYLVYISQGESISGGVSRRILIWPSSTLLSFVHGYFVPLGFVTWQGFNEAHLWHGHPTHTASWRCLDSTYMHLLIFFLRPRVCPIGFTGQGFGVATLMHLAPIDILSAYEPNKTTSTYSRSSDTTTPHSRALYSFSFDQDYFYPIGFLLLGKVLMRQP